MRFGSWNIKLDWGKPLVPIDIFVLAMLDKGGLSTQYDFQSRAEISSGVIRPALERLEKRKLINPKPGAGKKNYVVTKLGRKALEWHLFDLQTAVARDAEAALRNTWAAHLLDPSEQPFLSKSSRLCLRGIGQHLTKELEEHRDRVARLKDRAADPVDGFRWMRSVLLARRLEGEIQGLEEIIRTAEGLESSPERPKGRIGKRRPSGQ